LKIQQILYFLLQKSVFLFQESVLPVFWGRTDKKNVILQRHKQDKTSEVLAMLLLFCMLLSDHRQQTREESLKGVKKIII
jgi:hypothetical protein